MVVSKAWHALSSPFSSSTAGINFFSNQYFKKLVIFVVFLAVAFFILFQYTYPISSIGYSSPSSHPSTTPPDDSSRPIDLQFLHPHSNHFHNEGHSGGSKPPRLRVQGTQRRLPGALVIGVRKCGTRALIEMLNLHPDIRKRDSEMHFFDNDDRYSNGFEWYRKRMPYSFDNQITIEKTPSYFVSREAPARIKAMSEDIKLLIIVREPAMRVVSDYVQILESKKAKGGSYKPFHKLVLLPNGEINDRYSAIQISQYVVHILRWFRLFSRDQIHIIDGDMLILNPYPEIRKVEKFLNLPAKIKPSNFYFNRTKGFYCMRNETHQKCLADSKGRKHPYIDPTIMESMRRYFTPFNEQFYQIVGQNFTWPMY